MIRLVRIGRSATRQRQEAKKAEQAQEPITTKIFDFLKALKPWPI